MDKRKVGTCIAMVAALGLSTAQPARAQLATIDVAAIAQFIEQLYTMYEQLDTIKNHLKQAQQEYKSITGDRGMENLLSGTVRNYLPADWQALQATLTQSSNAFPSLSAAIQKSITANAILSPQQMAGLSVAERAQVTANRQAVAMLQATSQQALANVSQRFSDIQQLISAIGSATDQKAILDLQARISAEQGMLANDQSKLQTINQAVQAQQWANQQQARERALADVGSLRNLPALGL